MYFVRVEADGQHRQPSVLEANYVKGGYAYLVNASPGQYAAVGAMTIRVSSSPTYQHQFNATTGTIELVNPTCCDHKYEEYWYFPEAMVDETVVTVGPSRMVFMGEFKLSGDLWLGDADDMQTHYSDLLGGSKPGNAVTKLLYNVSNEFIAEYRKDESEKATQRFLKSSESLAELGWRAVIERALAEDGNNEGVTEQPDQQNGNK